jgi:hypothetical protein
MPNMPHLFADEVARSGGDVAHAGEHYRYRNSSRGYSGDAAGFYSYGRGSSWHQ